MSQAKIYCDYWSDSMTDGKAQRNYCVLAAGHPEYHDVRPKGHATNHPEEKPITRWYEGRSPMDSEEVDAIFLANKLLERTGSADPDDDLGILARQLMRKHEQLARADSMGRRLHDLVASAQSQLAERNETMGYLEAENKRLKESVFQLQDELSIDVDPHATLRELVKNWRERADYFVKAEIPSAPDAVGALWFRHCASELEAALNSIGESVPLDQLYDLGLMTPSTEEYLRRQRTLTHTSTPIGCAACDLTHSEHVEGMEVTDSRYKETLRRQRDAAVSEVYGVRLEE